MAKKRRFFQLLTAFCLVLALLPGPHNAAALNAEPAELPSIPASRIIAPEIPQGYDFVAENDNFQLYVNKTSVAFKVVDKRSGYIWNSNIDETIKGDRLNKTWKAFASSGFSIDYLDTKAIPKRLSITNTSPAIDVKTSTEGFEATVKFPEPSITILVRVTLEPEGVAVEIPFASLKEEDPNFKLGTLYLYPFFAYTRGDTTPGYMFIPDGSGSLIRFTNQTKAKNMVYGRYYGEDLGMITNLPYDPMVKRPYKISIPVSGMVHGEGENAYLAVVEKGATYGEIQAHPAGIITNFNFLYNAFVYNESYFQATNKSGAGVTTLQSKTNNFDIKIHYRFLTGTDSDYVGMARSYQQYLVERGELKKITPADANIGVRLEFLGGEKEKVLFWNRLIPMTTVSQMDEILSSLNVKNPDVVYFGWQPLGASTTPPQTVKLDSSLGNFKELRALVDKVKAGGGNFSLYYDPQAALINEGGYSPRYDLAMSITNANLVGFNRGKVNYYLNLPALTARYDSLSKEVFQKLAAGLALDNIGSTLYSDFKPGNAVNRENTILKYQSLLAAGEGRKAIYMPNDYLFGLMDAYYDMPLTDSGYIYTTDSIPFLQIVLAGYVPYYGPALNFSSDATDDLLRLADYGVYPSYFLTQDVTAKILNTHSDWIYTSSIGQWKQEVERTYLWLNNLLSPVKGQQITARQSLADGVVATTYANGKQIVVNYTTEPYTIGGVVVKAKDAILREVAP